MKNKRKINSLKRIIIIFIIIEFILINNIIIYASYHDNLASEIETATFSDDYIKWGQLSDEDKGKFIEPLPIEVGEQSNLTSNPLGASRQLSVSNESRFSLVDIVPKNTVVRNQGNSSLCWDFATLGMLESTLALKDYYNNNNKEGNNTYDFSEKHLDYASIQNFKNNSKNKFGYNRELRSNGNFYMGMSYLINGIGAVKEEDMTFDEYSKTDLIDINQLNKDVVTQVDDYIMFEEVKPSQGEDTTNIKNKIKNHLKNYGGVIAETYGDNISDSTYYNNSTGALFINNPEVKADHAILIVGWDDNFDKNNFNSGRQPKNNGAWIIKNSWGKKITYTKKYVNDANYSSYVSKCEQENTEPENEIPIEMLIDAMEKRGFSYDEETETFNFNVGKNGFMYISYEDYLVYSSVIGIINSENEKNYDNIYQYNYNGFNNYISTNYKDTYVANKFERKSTQPEYLTSVSINTIESDTFDVYVNQNNSNLNSSNLKKVELIAGDEEYNGAGYHTFNFKYPVELKGTEYAVAIKYNNDNGAMVATESIIPNSFYSGIDIESNKCFMTDNMDSEWLDLSKLSQYNNSLVNADSTIKAFTTYTKPKTEDIDSPEENINATAEIKEINSYIYSDANKQDYDTIDIEINGLNLTQKNNVKYYYYLSDKNNETNINDWIEVNATIDENGKIKFTANSKDIKNYQNIINSKNVYAYFKAEDDSGNATKTNAMKLTIDNGKIISHSDKGTQTYDNAEIGKMMTDSSAAKSEDKIKTDTTTAMKSMPNAGKNIFFIIGIIQIIFIGIIAFIKYKRTIIKG